jgi:probable ribonuclease FAU-1
VSLPSLRIRGIYATALSALLTQHGLKVVEASPVIAERLGLPQDGWPSVRLRDRPDQQGVRLEGTRVEAGQVARALAGLLPDAVPRELRGAPAVWEVEFPGGSKRALDEARAAVWPTIPGHHQLKIIAQGAVDQAEEALAAGRGEPEALAAKLRAEFVERALRRGAEIAIEHVKPDGRELRLRGRVARLDGCSLLVARQFRGGGSYDSLDVPKLNGDHGEVDFLAGSWVCTRRYLRASGALIGSLYNIQTPTELYPRGVRYFDLEVDVAVWPDGRAAVVDLPELAEAVHHGYISEPLAQRAREIAESVRATAASGATVELANWC